MVLESAFTDEVNFPNANDTYWGDQPAMELMPIGSNGANYNYSVPALQGQVNNNFDWRSLAPQMLSQQPVAPQTAGGQFVYTEDMLNRAMNFYNGFQGQQEGLYGTPATGPGGTTVQQASKISPQQQKRNAYIKYQLSKGLSQAEAAQKADAIIADPNVTFADTKGFKKFVKGGGDTNLKIKDGKIQANQNLFQGAAITSPNDAILGAMRGLGMEGINAAQGLAPLYGAEAASSLGYRQNLRDTLSRMTNQQTNANGLTPAEEMDLNLQENSLMQKLSDQNTSNSRGVLAAFSKFPSASLLGENLQHNVFDPQSRFLTEAYSALSGQRQNVLNQRAARNAQAQNNIINALGSAGNPIGMNQVTAGIMSPSQAGLFTDPQAAQLATTLQQQGIANRQQDYTYGHDIYGRSIMSPPQKSKGSLWNLLGPAGSLINETTDGEKGIQWGNVGQSVVNNAMIAAGVATGNPMLISSGVSGTVKSI